MEKRLLIILVFSGFLQASEPKHGRKPFKKTNLAQKLLGVSFGQHGVQYSKPDPYDVHETFTISSLTLNVVTIAALREQVALLCTQAFQKGVIKGKSEGKGALQEALISPEKERELKEQAKAELMAYLEKFEVSV